ncbi:MAG TPA: hypothetical protein VMU01_06345 [Rhizomicrobium sp.]|nr:hypothetical protein [Rhizomicrobium sp.]
MPRLKNALCAMLFCAPFVALAGCIEVPPVPDMSTGVSSPALTGGAPAAATAPVLLDDRMYVEVTFMRPDGTPRKALALVNMGSGGLILSNALFRELRPAAGKPLHMLFGGMDIAVDGGAVLPETMTGYIAVSIDPFAKPPRPEDMAKGPGGMMASLAAPLKVEAILPPGLLQHFEVVLDYGARTMTLAAPGTLRPSGVAVPVRLDPKTGFVTLDATIAGKKHPLVIDNGGSYSVLRDVEPLIGKHPDWLRSTGAIGPANLMMRGAGYEADDLVAAIPNVSFGPLAIPSFGAVQTGPRGWPGGMVTALFWDRLYAPKAGEQVDGWIGGNVLKGFRLTIDYANRMTYWEQLAPIDTHDLDCVGLVLARKDAVTTVSGVARKNGKPAVTGVQPGDKLVRIGGVDTDGLTRGALIEALHGAPGEVKPLLLERGGKQIEVDATVTPF